jgi:hypothetical protein
MRLTTTDAFFVAYQQQRGILMHFGVEVELASPPTRADLDRAIASTLERWPTLAQTIARGVAGLRWMGGPHPVLHTGHGEDIIGFRNTPIDPFREPPFGVLWSRNTLAFRCHHAAADGELFIAIVSHFLAQLASKELQSDNHFSSRAHPLAFSSLWRTTDVRPSLRYARWLADEAKAGRSLRLHLTKSAPGPIAICETQLDARDRDRLFERARDARVRPAWLIAAAWMQAMHAFSVRTNDAMPPLVSLEVPVTLRRRSDVPGNALAVTTLFGDARRELDDLARGLWRDYARHIKQRDHLAVPLLSAPVRFLPWPIFKRVAVTTTSTGFATSHFTWLDHATESMAIEKRRMYTPVCQHMGAALCALASRDSLQLSITHRTNGVSATDARALSDILLDQLTREVGRRYDVQQI